MQSQKKIMGVIDDIYQSISAKMETLSKAYEERLDILMRSQKVDLKSFISKEKNERLHHFDSYMKEQEEKFELSVYSGVTSSYNTILENLDSKNNLDNLKGYINDSLGKDCSTMALNMIEEMNGYYKL